MWLCMVGPCTCMHCSNKHWRRLPLCTPPLVFPYPCVSALCCCRTAVCACVTYSTTHCPKSPLMVWWLYHYAR
jgi:hypothetical protein